MKTNKKITFAIVFFTAFALVAQVLLSLGSNSFSATNKNTNTPTPTPAVMSSIEQGYVSQWITKNGLNTYGDAKDTVYTGGSPLFDETTGKTINLYSYILSKHPDRPWLK